MKSAYNLLIATALVLSLAACQDENHTITDLGWMDFNVTAVENEMAPPLQPFALTVATADGAYHHTWADARQFPLFESFIAGPYTAQAVSGTPDAEGYGCQCYIGEAQFEVLAGQNVVVPLQCALQQAIARVELGQGLLDKYPGSRATLHTTGHGYVEIDHEAEAPALIMPGSSQIFLTIPREEQEVTVACDFTLLTVAATPYKINIDLNGETLTIASGAKRSDMPLSDRLFDSPVPTIETEGFNSGQPISLVEGNHLSGPVRMLANAEAGLQSVMLTTVMGSGELYGMPSEVNLLDIPTDANLNGLKIRREGDTQAIVDYTDLLMHLATQAETNATFMLVARDRLGRVSQASILTVKVQTIELEITDFTPAVMGVNTTTVTFKGNTHDVNIDDFKVYTIDPDTGEELGEASILNLDIDSQALTAYATIDVGPGVRPVPLRIDYLGQPKLEVTIPRSVPEYKLTIDPFARTAVLAIEAETQEITAALTEYANVLANGKAADVTHRYPESGVIVVAGLEPSRAYDMQTVVVQGAYTPSVRVSTEEALPVPDGDFEDVGVPKEYKHLAQGGAYSTSEFPIFNMQNYTDIKVAWVQKYWANVNAKTFCRSAKRHNTWYMQVSSQLDYDYYVSGSKSMRLTSVGWSLDGPEIAPYLQDADNYLTYNANVPVVEHRSAGKLFLGEYKFNPSDASESYIEGMKFTSRPSSLNGFYKYTPDPHNPSDNGLVMVEIINDSDGINRLISFATMRLSASRDFIAFNLPLEYSSFGVKATKVKIMFSSSYNTGTIADEDAGVTATPDAQLAAYRGSVLWVDNLSFSY